MDGVKKVLFVLIGLVAAVGAFLLIRENMYLEAGVWMIVARLFIG